VRVSVGGGIKLRGVKCLLIMGKGFREMFQNVCYSHTMDILAICSVCRMSAEI
jgi:hypothetical protein